MHFTFVTLFPSLVAPYFEASILGRAQSTQQITCSYINPREASTHKHKKVDDYMVGGGAGLLMYPQPLDAVLSKIKAEDPEAHIIFPVPAGKPFVQNDAKRLARKNHIVFVCGRYEGIDERIIELYADELLSIGDYILTGGELASMVMCDAISRNIEGVLGNASSLEMESFERPLLEAPSFTQPKIFKNLDVTSEYLKGNHSKIADLKTKLSIAKTAFYRPKLLKCFTARKEHNHEK